MMGQWVEPYRLCQHEGQGLDPRTHVASGQPAYKSQHRIAKLWLQVRDSASVYEVQSDQERHLAGWW